MRRAAAAAVVVLALAVATPADAAPITAVSFTGESGTLSGGSGVNAVVNNSASKNGIRGLQLNATASRSYVGWGVPGGHRYASLRLWLRVRRRGAGESLDVVTLQNSRGTAHFDLFVNGRNGRLMWDLYRDDADSTSVALTTYRWYLVEAQVEFAGSESSAQVRIDGVDQGTIRSANSDATVSRLIVGSATAKTHTQDYDDVVLAVGDEPLGWTPAP